LNERELHRIKMPECDYQMLASSVT